MNMVILKMKRKTIIVILSILTVLLMVSTATAVPTTSSESMIKKIDRISKFKNKFDFLTEFFNQKSNEVATKVGLFMLPALLFFGVGLYFFGISSLCTIIESVFLPFSVWGKTIFSMISFIASLISYAFFAISIVCAAISVFI